MKLRNKLSLIYAVLIIIPVVALGLISYRISYNALTNEVSGILEKDLEKTADRLNSYLKSWMDKCYYISRNDLSVKWLPDDYTNNTVKTLDFYFNLNDLVNNIEANENIISNPKQSVVEFYTFNTSLFKDEYYVKDAKSFGQLHITTQSLNKLPDIFWLPVAKMKDQSQALTLCKKIYTIGYNQTVGFLCIRIPVSYFRDELLKIKLPPGGFIEYYGLDNSSICSIGSGETNLEGKKASTAAGSVDAPSIVITGSTPINAGKLVLTFPKSYLSQKVKSIYNITQVVVILSFILLVFFSYLAARLITKRFTRFVDSIRNHTNRKAIASIPFTGNDEIGILNEEFNQMIVQMDKLIEDRYKHSIANKMLQLELLQSQVNPHFLYNIMSSIKWVGNDTGNPVIGEIIDSIVRFYRLSLNNGSDILSIRTELDIIREYVNIQLFTYDDRFEVEYDIEEGICEFYMIKMILQPFIENSIIHGISGKTDGSGRIWLKGVQTGDDILFIVQDNGTGMDEKTLLQISDINDKRKSSRGYGVRNCIERIQLFYGSQYGIMIDSIKDSGTKVSIRIPKYTREEMENRLSQADIINDLLIPGER